jgi:P4 family phage/plasmid primase-like protien
MGIQEDLNSFIQKYSVTKGSPFTNTSIGHPKKSLYIPEENYQEFINIYSLAITNGIHLYFTEKPFNPSPLRVDLDFRFPLNQDDIDSQQKYNRIYTNKNIENIIETYNKIITKYINIKDEYNIAYVMEKSKPTVYRNKLKDGIHIVYPHIILTHNEQHFIRKKIIDMAENMFSGLPVSNNYEDIIDKAIIDVNAWQMYGSRKPDCEAYFVTKIFKCGKEQNAKLSAETNLNYIKLFSMRNNQVNTDICNIKEDAIKEIEEYTKHVLPSIDIKQKNKLHNNIFAKSLNINKNYSTDDELLLARRLVIECLVYRRAENYEDWINLGWVLRNIDYRLLDTWVEFSKIGTAYVEGECQTLWNKMRKDNMGMGTLRWWAKLDNQNKYDKIMDESLFPWIDKCIRSDGAHFDVAKVVQTLKKDDIRAISKVAWYYYDREKHRWKSTSEGLLLRITLSTDICNKFIERTQYWQNLHYGLDDDDQKTANTEKAKKSLKIAGQLKNAGFKDSVMKECKSLFIDEKFEELLDSRSHLIGFINGVYDLKMHIFRDGMPDDYISHSTKINYIPYNPDAPEIDEINDFFSKIFINESVKNYVLDIITCIIDGSISQERFYVFTGNGSNGKSRLLDFLQKTIGDYYCILPIALLTQKRAASNSAQGELERTKGRRFAVMQEPSEQDKINIGFMKELSGNDRILCRGLYKEPYEFKPQFKMILTCNELPEVPSDDGGTWRRIRVIEFLSKFCENPTKPNEFPMDLELSDKFERWAEHFMSMLIERHKHINPNNIHEPMEVRIATESYKNNNDIIGQYKTDRLNIDKSNTTNRLGINTIYNDFRLWCYSNMPKNKKQPDRNQLRAYFEKIIGPYPIDNKGWKGISIKSEEEEDINDT